MNSSTLSYERSPLENKNSLYSVGTAIAINTFEKEYHHKGHSAVMISVNTLLRNIINKDMSMHQILSHFTTELPTLLNEITSIMLYSKKHNPVIILYAIDYNRSLDPSVIRPITDSRKLLNDCISNVIVNREKLFGPKGDGVFNTIPTHFRIINTPIPPVHDKLFFMLKEITNHRKVTMISHNAIDYHIARYLDAWVLLESHTGEWKSAHQLSLKIFGDNCLDVPFYPSTHWCLGDKNLVLPGILPKDKKVLLEMAKKEHWLGKSSGFVLDRIINMFKPDKTIFK